MKVKTKYITYFFLFPAKQCKKIIFEYFKFCSLWSKTPALQSNKYGFLNHWENITLKKIFEFYQVDSIQELMKKKRFLIYFIALTKRF